MKINIPLCPRTKKNHQRIATKGGRHFVLPSSQYEEYEQSALWYIRSPQKPINCPVCVKCLFYMETHRRVDLVNLQEAILDILVKAGVLADDNSNIVASMDGSRVLYDKEHPRTEIEIERIEE